nr:hypothetical protein [Tanacetum cinerariifolium]
MVWLPWGVEEMVMWWLQAAGDGVDVVHDEMMLLVSGWGGGKGGGDERLWCVVMMRKWFVGMMMGGVDRARSGWISIV